MSKWIRRSVVACALLGVVVALPAMVGCNKRPDPRANPDFKEENLDPSKVKMEPIGGPGGKPEAAK